MTNTERIQANNAELREAIEMAETLPEAGGGGVSVQADWNQTDETAADFIKNKPIVIEGVDTLTWDGDMTGREYVEIDDVFLVHVSDATPTVSDLANGSTFSVFFCEVGQSITGAITGEDIIVGTGALSLGTYIAIAAAAGAELDGLVFPKKGVYFVRVPAELYISGITINGYTGFEKECIDPEYLPNNQLYTDGTYLYKTSAISDASSRITKSELNIYVKKNPSIKINMAAPFATGVLFAAVAVFANDSPHAEVFVNDGSTAMTLYTAEYTP